MYTISYQPTNSQEQGNSAENRDISKIGSPCQWDEEVADSSFPEYNKESHSRYEFI